MRRYKIALLFGLLALAPLAPCTDDSDDGGIPSAGGEETAAAGTGSDSGDMEEQLLAFSQCMRDEGIADFPDPEPNGDGGWGLTHPEDMDPEGEDLLAAEAACEDLFPAPGAEDALPAEEYEALVEHAECIRNNGVPDYADPEPNGGIQFSDEMETEEFKNAMEACRDLDPNADQDDGVGE